jgi:hypothetical protein
MFKFNADMMQLDDGQPNRRIVSTERTDTSKITDADMQAASIAAARELAAVPYADLPADVKKSMTATEKREYITAQREEAARLDREEATFSDPLQNPDQRPDAQTQGDNNYIIYYSWVGGTKTGNWRPTRVPRTEENLAIYGGRQVGGPTRASETGKISDANTLVVQPTPIRDNDGQITGWEVGDTNAIDLIGTDGTTDGTGSTGGTNNTGTGTPNFRPGGTGGTGNTGGIGGTGNTSGTGGTGGTGGTTSTTSTVPTGLNAETAALVKSLQDQIAALTKQVTNTTTAANTLEERQRKENALASLTSRFSKYKLESLIPKIKELVINGSTEATIALELQETPEYQQRFKANAERLKKGLSALDPGAYIGMEDSYRQALRAYGLKQFDTDDYVSQFIANDVSANELSNRIVTAVQRVQNADPAITKQLKDFYNIGQNDLVAYVLDPNQQFQKIERQVQAAEIGVAAARQGITAGVQVAEQLAAQGVTQAEAQKGYATIADILPDAKKLSEIYGSTLDSYDLGQAEQEVFNQLASAQRKRQKLTQREIAAFGGSSGTNKTSLTTSSVGQF